MRPALFISALVLTVAPMGVGQKQSASGSHGTSVEEAIRKLDNERIQAQIHADAIKGRRISMNLCLNAFVIQFSDGLLDTCSVTAARALLLPYAHRRHCKDEGRYKECWSHVEFFISLTIIRRRFVFRDEYLFV